MGLDREIAQEPQDDYLHWQFRPEPAYLQFQRERPSLLSIRALPGPFRSLLEQSTGENRERRRGNLEEKPDSGRPQRESRRDRQAGGKRETLAAGAGAC